METVRLRVVFEDRHILSKSQRSEGLKRSWLLLKPPHETISDLSSYLLHIFDLYHSCPNGITLSMDGFVLPQFESTCILKDKDAISVKRKGGLLSEIVEVGDGANLIEDVKIVDKQPVLTDVPLLANEEFEKETGGYQSDLEEDEDNQSEELLHVENSTGENAVSKKRKASKKLQSSKKKKKCSIDNQDAKNDFPAPQKESCRFHPGKSNDKKKKVSDVKSKLKAESTSKPAEKDNEIVESLPSPKRCGQLQENGTGCINMPMTPDGTKKVPSRSARRKKAKRQWLRELLKAEKKELATSNMRLNQSQSSEKETHDSSIEHQLNQMQSPEKETPNSAIDHQVKNQNCEADNEIVADDEIVPIVIRPGHIRFEPVGKDHAVQPNQVSMDMFQWNGITSKKKGQKWGTEKVPSWRNDYKDPTKERSGMTMERVKPPNDLMMTVEKVNPPNEPIDFDKLAPFTSVPKEGDVVAYRLLELSSTWTPELSPFRVGKTSRYDLESNRVLLTPVPEYPITSENPDEDACAQLPDNSLYGEDGSLEIDFSSLVDVRIVKQGNSDSAKEVTGRGLDVSMGDEIAKSTAMSNNGKQTQASTQEKEANVWEEISQALSAKKAELIQENGWNKESSGKSPWSYRALRSSALGPTMAILRARNDI